MKKWILGIAIIIAAIISCIVVPYFDGNESTSVDLSGAVEGVKQGVETIKTEDAAATTTTTGTTPATESK